MMKVWQPSKDEIEETQHWGIWEKEVSEFPWQYVEKETCYILEGEVKVTDTHGTSIQFKAGDMVVFEKGLTCTWKITRDVKKRYNFG